MIVDLFAGPGGWSEGLRSLGLVDVGFEWDPAACATRAAAGHVTVRADVADYPTEPLRGRVTGLIASPPCQAFSVAGKREGRPTAFLAALEGRYDAKAVRAEIAEQRAYRQAWERDKEKLLDEHPEWLTVREIDELDGVVEEAYLTGEGLAAVIAMLGPAPPVEDERGMFMAEAVRWAEDLSPEWIACEQVPPGLDMWRLFARWLGDRGYSTWCGVLNAADYGVPQTRRRAILMASRARRVAPPPPTHCDQRHSPSLFLLPWVSMAEALGWPEDRRTGHETVRGAGMRERHGERPVPSATETSQTITSKARSWKVRTNDTTSAGGLYERSIDEPAPTIRSRVDLWELDRTAKRARPRHADEPAPSIAFGHNAASWTVQTHQRASAAPGQPRGYYERETGRPCPTLTEGARMWWVHGEPAESVMLTVEEALVLQSFPADYPLQGSRTAMFRQVGDAVPPQLAAAVVEALTR